MSKSQRHIPFGKAVLNAISTIVPGFERRKARKHWNDAWANTSGKKWTERGVAPEIKEAVKEWWFPRSGNVLELGCGEGDVANWMAEQGYDVVAADISSVAIDRARARFDEPGMRLQFVVQNICQESPDEGLFDIIINCGGFHQKGVYDKQGFAKHVAAACRPGARYLLFIKAVRTELGINDPEGKNNKVAWIEQTFGSNFSLDRVELIYLDKFRGSMPGEELPGLVFWLTRSRD